MRILTLIFLLSIFSFKTNEDRTPIKLLKDAESKKIDWTPKKVTISYLNNFVQLYPKDFNKSIRHGYEFNCYEFVCLIKSYSLIENGNFRLVLSDSRDTSKTIKAELINPENAEAKKSNFVNSFSQTMIEFKNYIKRDSTLSNAYFTVMGVAFFNSDSKIELAPIMDFQIKEKIIK